MSLEDQVQPVVTVAAFDPMNDHVVVLKRSYEAKTHPGLYEAPGGKVEQLDGNILDRIIEELQQEIRGIIAKEHLVSAETIAIRRHARTSLLSYRYCGALRNSNDLSIPPEEAHEHPSFRFVSSDNFHTLEYVPEVKDFLARLFEEKRRTGTLLSTLKQPVYIRSTFLDPCNGRALVPMDDCLAGMPCTLLREEQKHLNDVLGEVVHRYLNAQRKHAQVVRMNVAAKRLVHGKTEIPAWILDYGIMIEPEEGKEMIEKEKVVAVKVRNESHFKVDIPDSYSEKVRHVLEEMRISIAETMMLAKPLHTIRFPQARKRSLEFR